MIRPHKKTTGAEDDFWPLDLPRSWDMYPQTLPGTDASLLSATGTLDLFSSGGLVGSGFAAVGCRCICRSPVSCAGTYEPRSCPWLEFHLNPPALTRGREQPTAASRTNCSFMATDMAGRCGPECHTTSEQPLGDQQDTTKSPQEGTGCGKGETRVETETTVTPERAYPRRNTLVL